MAEPRAETRFAKQLFLYGAGDGMPVRNVARLEELSGVGEQTIRKYLSEWEREAEKLLSSSSDLGLALQLSAEKLRFHESDMNHLRDQISQIKYELDSLEKITARLSDWLDKFDGEELPLALQIFSDWQRACGQKSSLRSQFLAMQKQWTSLVGIVDLKDIQVVREKEISKGKAKLEIRNLENSQELPVRQAIGGGVFVRSTSSETAPKRLDVRDDDQD